MVDVLVGTAAKATLGGTLIKGLNKITTPKLTRATTDVVEFGKTVDGKVTTNATWSDATISGNHIQGDTTGQDAVRNKLFSNTAVNDLWLYINNEDFFAPDLARDADSAYRATDVSNPDIDKNSIIPFSATMVFNGELSFYDAHSEAGTDYSFDGNTITVTGEDFTALGFKVGDSVIIEGSATNDGYYGPITSVTSTVITLANDDVLTTEIGLSATVIHGGQYGSSA